MNITIPRETWDAVTEALKHSERDLRAYGFSRLHWYKIVDAALTAAKAVTSECSKVTSEYSELTNEHLQAAMLCREHEKVSVSLVQRRMRISYNKAQEICQAIINAGIVPGLTIAPSLTTAVQPQAQEGCKTCQHFTQGKNQLVGVYEMDCFECCHYYASKYAPKEEA